MCFGCACVLDVCVCIVCNVRCGVCCACGMCIAWCGCCYAVCLMFVCVAYIGVVCVLTIYLIYFLPLSNTKL